ncbi:MAG: hypothetical protein GTN36_01735 [Candidatus Aenigmarchaeota archaeon]|nr:hypothetical protein [Candidatus Aenigmarchaeota archaeon]
MVRRTHIPSRRTYISRNPDADAYNFARDMKRGLDRSEITPREVVERTNDYCNKTRQYSGDKGCGKTTTSPLVCIGCGVRELRRLAKERI